MTKPKDVDFLLGQTPERPSPPFLSFLLNTQQFKRTLIGAKSTTTNQDGPKHARTDPPVKRQESFLSDDIPKYSTDTATTTATATATATASTTASTPGATSTKEQSGSNTAAASRAARQKTQSSEYSGANTDTFKEETCDKHAPKNLLGEVTGHY